MYLKLTTISSSTTTKKRESYLSNHPTSERKGKNMPVRPKAIFIGPQVIGEHLAKLRKDWEFVSLVDNIASLWEGLNNQSIDDNVQAIVTLDGFFKPDSDDDASFEQLVAMMSPHCFFVILAYRPEYEGQIRSRISAEAHAVGNGDNEEYYFVDPKRPNLSIDRALAEYISNTDNRDVAAILDGREIETDNSSDLAQTSEPAAPVTDYSFDEIESDRLGQVVAITSSKGGSGKSTVATTLATYLAHSSINSVKEEKEERPLKIVILDLDVRDGQIGFLTGNLQPSVIHMRTNGITQETLEETIIHSERLKVDLLLAPKRPRVSDDTPAEFYLELIQFLKKFYDYVILDTSVNYLDPLLEKVAYPLSDQIIFVSDIVVHSVYSMTRWIQEVTKPKEQHGMGIDKKKIGIVVNKSMANINMSGEKIARSALGLPVLTVIPNNAKLLAHAANLQSMEAILRHNDIRAAIKLLARRIVGRKYKLSDDVS